MPPAPNSWVSPPNSKVLQLLEAYVAKQEIRRPRLPHSEAVVNNLGFHEK